MSATSVSARIKPATLQPWSSGAFMPRLMPNIPEAATEFEREVAKLGLINLEGQWPHSKRLRAWAKAHRNSRYIPEWYLQTLGYEVDREAD